MPEAEVRGEPPSDELKLWRGRVELARWYMENYGNTDHRWDKFTKALASDFGNRTDQDGADQIDVNMVHGTTVTSLSPLYTTEIHIAVRPTSQRITIGDKEVDNVERARFTELELNHWWREKEVRTRVLRPCAYDAETTNHMFAYVGYVRPGDSHRLKDDKGRLEYNPTIRAGEPFIIRLSPRHVLVPPGYPEFDEAPWIAIGWRKQLDVVKRTWPETTMDLKPTIDMFNFDNVRKEGKNPILDRHLDTADVKLVQLWQIWDRMDQQLITIAEDHNEIIEKAGWPSEVEGFPVAHESFVEVPDEFHGSPPIQMYWPQQMELNAARTASKKRNNRLKNVILIKSDLAEEFLQKYALADDGSVIPVPLEGEDDIRKHIMVDPGMNAPHEAYADGSVQIGDILFTTGLGPQQRGQGDPNAPTATASANVDKWALVRSVDRGDRMKNFILKLAKKLWHVLQQNENVEVERMIKGVTGTQATSAKYSLAQLFGEFGFDLDVGSLMADNPSRRQTIAMANYNLLRQDPEAEPKKLILDILDSQGKPDPSSYMADLRDPEEEFGLMARGLPTEPNARDDHAQHHQAHMQQAQRVGKAIDEFQGDLDSAEGQKLRLFLALLMSHIQATAIFIKQITGEAPGGAGKPVQENAIRSQMAGVADGGGGAETPAEAGGQALSADAVPSAQQGGIGGNMARGG